MLLWTSGVVFAAVQGAWGPRMADAGLPAAAKLWLLGGNIAVALGVLLIGPLVPQGPPVNRKVGLEGSRFSPVKAG
jgi:hypothetical protein